MRYTHTEILYCCVSGRSVVPMYARAKSLFIKLCCFRRITCKGTKYCPCYINAIMPFPPSDCFYDAKSSERVTFPSCERIPRSHFQANVLDNIDHTGVFSDI